MALLRLWRGEMPLADAFWSWAVLGGLLVNITTSIGFLWLIMAGQMIPAYVVGYGMSLPYNLVVTVGTLRSAAQPEADPRWAGVAKIAVVLLMTVLSLT